MVNDYLGKALDARRLADEYKTCAELTAQAQKKREEQLAQAQTQESKSNPPPPSPAVR